MQDDFDFPNGNNTDHPDNNITAYVQIKNNFCNMINNTNFAALANDTNNFEIFLSGIVEGSGATNINGVSVSDDDSVIIGIGLRNTNTTICN
jgi:hypothetical protein